MGIGLHYFGGYFRKSNKNNVEASKGCFRDIETTDNINNVLLKKKTYNVDGLIINMKKKT